jgi:hypothetical protein
LLLNLNFIKQIDEKNEDIMEITTDLALSKLTNFNNNEISNLKLEKDNEDERVRFKQYKPGQFNIRGSNIRSRKNHISLQRISQRVKKTDGCFWSGHMIYYTNLKPDVCIMF